ncbi:MAG: hypothetical protein LCH26_01225 [Proteobacteria bacterium]|nr:hypothetical protein [Pseudomonadota bacterium]
MIIKGLLMGALCVVLLTKDACASSESQRNGLPQSFVVSRLNDFKNGRQVYFPPAKRAFEKCGWRTLPAEDHVVRETQITEVNEPASPTIYQKYSAYQTFEVLEADSRLHYQLRICAIKRGD